MESMFEDDNMHRADEEMVVTENGKMTLTEALAAAKAEHEELVVSHSIYSYIHT